MFETVTFDSDGAQLRGRWYRPNACRSLPVVVMTHGFSATITMTADRYADVFCEAGLGVLLYDHRNLGASDGEPRYQINPWLQARGYRDAITHVTTMPGVDADRIALWGDSLSAAVALVVAGIDSRVAAVVAQVPATGRETAPADPTGELYDALRHTMLHGDISGGPQDTVGPLPVVSADQIHAPSLLQPISGAGAAVREGARVRCGRRGRRRGGAGRKLRELTATSPLRTWLRHSISGNERRSAVDRPYYRTSRESPHQ
jgi:uncharacterized protein